MLRLSLAIFAMFGAAQAAQAQVKTGLDVLIAEHFRPLAGKRVGLATNQTGVSSDGRRNIDIFAHAGNLKLTAIFSFEHGLNGTREDNHIDSSVDEATGVPIYSLYNGTTRKPTPEMLKNVDVLVYDKQDNGARFYTSVTSMAYVMESAAENHLPYYVLDRPNGINGVEIGGPLLEAKYVSFVTYMPGFPIRHGMTMGEMARYFNGEKKLGADLHVVKMQGWKRSMWYDQTGLEWVNPSPNIRNLTEAILYPGTCLLEGKQVSVGRGTDTPFEIVGAPWYRAREVAEYLHGLNMPGVRFLYRRFRPDASVYKGQECNGLDIQIVDRAVFDPVLMGMELLAATMKFHPGKVDPTMRLLGSDEVLAALKAGKSGRQILDDARGQLEQFRKIRAKYLLYK
ncbi:MAG: exo-beta-N-acetylmuramidase NamZ family protein [Bryobacteraceae bacterium]